MVASTPTGFSVCVYCGLRATEHGDRAECPTPPGAPPSWFSHHYTPAAPTNAAAEPAVARRLVVDLQDDARRALAEVCSLEVLNKTVVTNRSLRLYHRVRTAQQDGTQLVLQHPDGTTERLTIL